MSFDSYQNAMVEKHREWYKNFGADYRALGWGSESGMYRRFSTVCRGLEVMCRGETVLDVGCGFGDLVMFPPMLQSLLEGKVVEYVGIDLVPEFVDVAKSEWAALRRKATEGEFDELAVSFDCVDVFRVTREFGVVVALGVAWLGDGKEFLLELMKKCVALSRVGAIVSVTSEKTTHRRDAGWNLLSVMEFAEMSEEVSERFVMMRDYSLTDMMVYLFKKGFERW